MANTKISELDAAGAITGAELVPVVQDGDTVQATVGAMLGTWADYTPTTTGVTLGTGGVLATRYARVGDTVHFHGYIELGTGGDFTASPTVTLPVAARAGNPVMVGEGHILHPGNYEYTAQIQINPTTGLTGMFFHSNWGSSAGNVNSVSPYNWDAGGKLYWNITYEAA